MSGPGQQAAFDPTQAYQPVAFDPSGTYQGASADDKGNPTPSVGDRLTRGYNPDMEAFAEKHPVLGVPARFFDSAGGAAMNFLPSIYHAFTDPLTPEEEANFKGHSRIPGEVVLERLSGAEAGVQAAKDYASGKVTPKAALSMLPEALGAGTGTVAAGMGTGETVKAATPIAKGALDAAANIAPRAIRATARGVNTALTKAPEVLGGAAGAAAGHAAGIPEGGLLGYLAGKDIGRALIPKVQIPGEGFGLPNRVEGGPSTAPQYDPSIYPGAPLPEHPGVFPGANFPEHPGEFPGAPFPEHPGTFPGAPLPEAIGPEVAQARGLAEGAKPAPEPAAVLAKLPVQAVHQAIRELGTRAAVADVTTRAAQIAKLSELLNQGLGGKELQPNVPLRDQVGVVTPKPTEGVPEGHTPVDSSALKSYKYDPQAQEFESVTQTGAHYIHGDVSPDQAAAFEAADSKGKAWNELRKNSTLVAKVINGQRIPVRPVVSEDNAISPEEWDAGHALGTEVEGTPNNAKSETTQAANPATATVPTQPANGRSNPSPAVYSPRQPELPVASGTRTDIKVPGSDQSYPAQYEVRELSDVHPSHSGTSFQPNPKYALTNDRDYSNPANQAKVVENSSAEKFDPSYHITDNPDATNGPIVIDSDGHALGGNGRAMILQRVYQHNPEGAAQYRMMLANKSPQFGVDPMQVLGMKQPVLVRKIADADLPHTEKQTAITDFNKVGTAQLTTAERALADSRRVSQGTLDSISARIESQGADATLSDALQGKSGTDILDKLIEDGVVSPQERAGLANENGLTIAGKDRISKLTVGRFFRDPAQMDATPAAIRNKLESIAAPLARVDGVTGWDLTRHVQDALDILEEARAHNLGNVRDVISQSSMFGGGKYSAEAVAMAEQLKNTGTRMLTKQMRQYAQDAQDATGQQQTFGAPVTADQAFRDAFGQ